MGSQVGLQIVVDERSIRFQGLLQVSYRVQRLQIDQDVCKSIFGDVAAFGDDGGKGLTQEPDLVLDQRNLGARVENDAFDGGGWDDQRWSRLPGVTHVLGRVDGYHPRSAAGCRNIDAPETRVGVVTAQKGGVEHARYLHVVHEQGLPGQQARVLGPCHSSTYVLFGHSSTPHL